MIVQYEYVICNY